MCNKLLQKYNKSNNKKGSRIIAFILLFMVGYMAVEIIA